MACFLVPAAPAGHKKDGLLAGGRVEEQVRGIYFPQAPVAGQLASVGVRGEFKGQATLVVGLLNPLDPHLGP